MENLKVAYVDFWPEFIPYENIFRPILSNYFSVIIDEKNPDIVIHSIFNGQRDIGRYKNVKKIMFLGENYRPSQFDSDYSISFDIHSGTNYHLPLWQYFLLLNPQLNERIFTNKPYDILKYDRFCSFVVSNGNSFIRNGFYNQLSQYKHVNSYGRYLTNSYELQTLFKETYWRDAKYELFNEITHKFSICFENNVHPGYCTEKLMDGFLGGGIPIYYGDPKINKDFNKEAFINATTLGLGQALELIKELDNDDQKYLMIKKQHIFTPEQREKHLDNLGQFENWLINIINN